MLLILNFKTPLPIFKTIKCGQDHTKIGAGALVIRELLQGVCDFILHENQIWCRPKTMHICCSCSTVIIVWFQFDFKSGQIWWLQFQEAFKKYPKSRPNFPKNSALGLTVMTSACFSTCKVGKISKSSPSHNLLRGNPLSQQDKIDIDMQMLSL